MTQATEGISPKLGVPTYYISTAEGEADTGNETNDRYLQDQYAMDIAKIDALDLRMQQYDLKRVFLVSTLIAGLDLKTVNDPTALWQDDQVDMMMWWEKITWRQACLWQLTLNRRVPVGSADRTSMDWALLLLYNSCTKDLKDQVGLKYDHLPPYYKGAVTYLWLLLQCLFKTSRDQIQSLKKFLKIFAKKGLRKYPGESVVKAKIPLMAACKRLHAVGQLDDDATTDVLQAFVKCSVPKFVNVFSLMLQECERANILPGGPRIWGHATTMDELTYVVSLAQEHFGNIHQVHEWNVPKGGKGAHAATVTPANQTCWNCEKPNCTPSTCSQPRDEARIAKNRKEYFEKKRQQQQSNNNSNPGRGGSGRGGGRGGNSGRGRGGRGSNEQYSREKWGTPSSANVVVWHDGVPHTYCATCRKKEMGNRNGWNSTHSTKFHDAAQKDGFSVLGSLAAASPDHPLVAAVRSTGRGGTTVEIPSLQATSSGSSLTGTSREQSMQIFRQFATMAKNDDERKIVDDLQSALALK